MVFLVAAIINTAKWQQKVDSKLIEVDRHISSEIIHMPFREQSEIFVPRVELDSRLKNIEHILDRIEEKID